MANPVIHIDADGTLTVDGKVVTPAEANTVVSDAHKAYIELMNRKNWTVKNAEKVLMYGVGLVGATNGFSFLSLNAGLRATLVGAAAFVVAMVHHSTPTKAA